jgi:Mg-chelatase subunit ChlD
MPIAFDTPPLLVLALPVIWLWAVVGRTRSRMTSALRLVIALVLVAAIAGPRVRMSAPGTDVILVLDRSQSMPQASEARLDEIVRLVDDARGERDRVGVISFGTKAVVEKTPSRINFSGFAKRVDPSGSDLAAALEEADAVASGARQARMLVVSDGEYTGRDPVRTATVLAARGRQVSYRRLSRVVGADAAAVSLDLPETARKGERYQLIARVHANRAMPATWQLARDGSIIAKGERELTLGENIVFLRDIARESGLRSYEFTVTADGDTVPENNSALGAVRVEGPVRVLVVNERGDSTGLTQILRAGGLDVDNVPSRASGLSPAKLDRYRVLCIENVPAGDFGPGPLSSIRRWVEMTGAGLLITGGRASFGSGGYFRSPLDEALPVSMELREELRRFSVALVSVLDRSGSMAAPAADGKRTKMDLAALGASAAIELLSDNDQVGVIAVDSMAHPVVRLTSAAHKGVIIPKVRSIKSMGGGIFVYTGLMAGSRMLAGSSIPSKHLILFSDAADSEEPGQYKELIEKMRAAGMTISVIGLGSEMDCDANLLKDIAKRGGGEIYFTNRADDLPRLFSQEVMRVSRSSFIEEETAARTLSGMVELGVPDLRFPSIGGYNACFLRKGASCAAMAVPPKESTDDTPPSPLLAFWRRGLGRTAALAIEADGKTSGNFAAWEHRTRMLATLTRWLAGEEQTSLGRPRVSADVGEATVRFEIEPGKELAVAAAAPELVIMSPEGEAPEQRVELKWETEHVLVGKYPLSKPGIHFATIDFGGLGSLRAPPVAQSYAPEFLPRTGEAATLQGEDVLKRIAEATGGSECVDLASLFAGGDGTTSGIEERHLGWLLAAVAAVLLILEIAGRRLALWSRVASVASAASGAVVSVVRRLKPRRVRRDAPATPKPVAETDIPVAQADESADVAPMNQPAAATDAEEPKQDAVADAMAEIMRRRRKR